MAHSDLFFTPKGGISVKGYKGYQGKRMLDVCVAFSLLAFSMPLCILIVLAVRIFSGRPVIYRRESIGFKEKPFYVFKFRSMADGADTTEEEIYQDNEYRKPMHDPRITGIGWFLRKASLDELPQLLNVLKGQMSLVGPRPIPRWAVRRLSEERKQIRFSLLPGITGPGQIAVRQLSRLSPDHKKLEWEYFERCSFWLDYKILLKTILVVISGRGAY